MAAGIASAILPLLAAGVGAAVAPKLLAAQQKVAKCGTGDWPPRCARPQVMEHVGEEPV